MIWYSSIIAKQPVPFLPIDLPELEIKETPHLLHISIHEYKFIVTKNYPQDCVTSSIQAVPALGVNISQLIRYNRVCYFFQDFKDFQMTSAQTLFDRITTSKALVKRFRAFTLTYIYIIIKVHDGQERLL